MMIAKPVTSSAAMAAWTIRRPMPEGVVSVNIDLS
jgi:hypothetical protein